MNSKISPLEREILLSSAIRRSKEYIIAHPEKKLSRLQIAKFKKYSARRVSGEPVAYIVGKKEFFGLDFFVNKNVLIPRPETELLVEKAISSIVRCIEEKDKGDVIDLGTGSGNIIISIYKNLPRKIANKINFFAVDISKDALKIAEANARKHNIVKYFKFIRSDLLEYFFENKNNLMKNIFIIANLPYVSPKLYKKNKKDLRYEPRNALVGKKKGLHHYERLIKAIRDVCKECPVSQASCYMEISPEQKPKISQLVRKHLPSARCEFAKDLAGKWRVIELNIST